MNRRFFLFFFLVIYFIGSLYSQAPFRCGQLSASASPINFLSHSDTIVPHTQKTIICDFDTVFYKSPVYRTVGKTDYQKSDGKIISKIVLTQEDDFVSDDCTKYLFVTMPDSIRITDINYYKDTVYFCGYFNTINRQGYIASVPLNDLFVAGVDNVKYIPIGYTINKIITFPDANNLNSTSIFAMGTIKKEYEPYALPSQSVGSSPIWVYPPDKYFDCVLLHDVSLNQVRIFQTDKDTLFEKFQDISVSQGNAELVSLIFDTANNYYTPNAVRTSKLLAYRKFTTPDMQIVKNIMEIKYYDNLTNTYYDTNIAKGIYNVKIKHLESDNFALTFSMYSGRMHSVIVNRVKFNKNYNNAKFVNLLSSEIYRGIMSKDIIDMSYSQHNERLMVLARDKNDRGGVYDINIEPTIDNYFYKTTPSSNYTTIEYLPVDTYVHHGNGYMWSDIGSFNGIVKMKYDAFRLVGEYKNGTLEDAYATFQFVRGTESDCHENINTTITNKPFPININMHETEWIETSYLQNVSYRSFIIPEYLPGYYVGNCENLNLENIYK